MSVVRKAIGCSHVHNTSEHIEFRRFGTVNPPTPHPAMLFLYFGDSESDGEDIANLLIMCPFWFLVF